MSCMQHLRTALAGQNMHVQAFEQHPHAKQAQVLRACIRVHAWARPCARAWRAHGPVSTDQTQAPRLHAHTQQQHLPARQTQTTVRRCAWNTRIRVAVVHEERRLVRPRPNGQCRQPQTEQYGRRRCPAAVPSRTTHAITVATTGRVLSPCRRPPALLVSAHPVLAARLSSSSHFPTLRDGGGNKGATIDVIVGILAEHRWKHLVQIGQLLPSQYQLLTFAWHIKISSRNERTWEMYLSLIHI